MTQLHISIILAINITVKKLLTVMFSLSKKHVQQGTDKRAAGELEGARPASNTINRRPKVLMHQ